MKKLLIIAVAFMVAASAMAQDTNSHKWYFGGGRIDYKPNATWHATGGTAFPLGKNLWAIPSMDIGGVDSAGVRTSSLQTSITWMFYGSNVGALHLFLEPSIDWVNQDPDANAYLSGSIGILGLLKTSWFVKPSTPIGSFVGTHIGIFGAWKYKTDFQASSSFPAGNSFGFGLAYRY